MANQCIAFTAAGYRCTRKTKNDNPLTLCGTHYNHYEPYYVTHNREQTLQLIDDDTVERRRRYAERQQMLDIAADVVRTELKSFGFA